MWPKSKLKIKSKGHSNKKRIMNSSKSKRKWSWRDELRKKSLKSKLWYIYLGIREPRSIGYDMINYWSVELLMEPESVGAASLVKGFRWLGGVLKRKIWSIKACVLQISMLSLKLKPKEGEKYGIQIYFQIIILFKFIQIYVPRVALAKDKAFSFALYLETILS